MDTIIENAPSWAIGISLVLLVLREIWITVKTNSLALQSILRYQKVYDVLSELNRSANSSRAVLWKGHNTGAPLDGFSKMYSSLIAYQTNIKEWEPLSERWHRVQVDAEYIKSITPIFKGVVHRIDYKDLAENSLLKNLYAADGIVCSYVVLVQVKTEKRSLFDLRSYTNQPKLVNFTYLSINFNKEVNDLPQLREVVRGAANSLKRLL